MYYVGKANEAWNSLSYDDFQESWKLSNVFKGLDTSVRVYVSRPLLPLCTALLSPWVGIGFFALMTKENIVLAFKNLVSLVKKRKPHCFCWYMFFNFFFFYNMEAFSVIVVMVWNTKASTEPWTLSWLTVLLAEPGLEFGSSKSCMLVLSLIGVFLPHGYWVNNSRQDFI